MYHGKIRNNNVRFSTISETESRSTSTCEKVEKPQDSRPKVYVTFARQVINYQGCESVYETADLSNYKLRLDDICVGSYAPLEFSGYIYQSVGMPQYKPEINV